MRIFYFIKVITAVLCASIGGATSALALDISDLERPEIIKSFSDGVVLPLMKKHHSASGVVSILKDGKIIFTKGYGYQNLEKNIPVDPVKTLFRPGSISKLFTWVSVMQMVEQGKLDLDVDINRYLKTFQIKDTFPGQPVTMRHIMTHTSGFEDGGLGYLIIRDKAKAYPLVEAMKRFQPARVNPPGAQTAYSNYGTAVAGLIVANLSGIEFTDYVQTQIFDVLGMESSTFKEPLPGEMAENMAVGYTFGAEQYRAAPFEIVSSFSPAGAMSTTAPDMMKFAQAILNGGILQGGRILEESTVTQMLTRNFSHDDRMMGLALGFYETEQNNVRLLGHGGNTGFFHSDFKLDLANNLAFFVSFSGQEGALVTADLVPTLYDIFAPSSPRTPLSSPEFAQRAAKYAGEYKFWRSSFSKMEKLLLLLGGMPVAVSENDTLIVSGMGEFEEIDHNLFQKKNSDKKIAFQENAEGEITGFVVDGLPFMSTFKAPFYYTGGFNFLLLGLSTLMFIGVILRGLYQRSMIKAQGADEQNALRGSLWMALLNIATFVLFALVIVVEGQNIGAEMPLLLKLWLIMPIIVTVVGLYHLYCMVRVWQKAIFSGIWARIRYSMVSFGALFMCWFYYFWNLTGFQYLS